MKLGITKIAANDNDLMTSSRSNDWMFLTTDTSQRILMTTNSNVGPALIINNQSLTTTLPISLSNTDLIKADSNTLRYQISASTGYHAWQAASTELARMTGTGSFGIGTNAPTHKLDVVGNARIRDTLSVASNITFSNQIIAGTTDTNTTPAYTWDGDTTTGIYHPVTNTVAVTTAGAERLRVTSTGFVGIGTSNPTVALDVTGSARVTGTLTASNIIGDGSGLSNLNASALTTGTVSSNLLPSTTVTPGTYGSTIAIPQVTVDSKGRITTITNTIPNTFYGATSDTSNAPSFTWSNNSNTGIYRPITNTVAVTTAGAERLRVTSTGFVGIGTSNPTVALDVTGSARVTGTLTASNIIGDGSGLSNLNASALASGNVASNLLPTVATVTPATYGALTQIPQVTIDTKGRVTTASNITLDTFQGNATDTSNAPSFTWSGDTNTGMYHPAADTVAVTTAGVERMRVTSTGLVGIGTSNPINALDIVQNQNAGTRLMIGNSNSHASALTQLHMQTNQGIGATGLIFKNSTLRTADGGANTMTMRNDGGALRLQASTGLNTTKGIWINGSDNFVGINTSNPSTMLDVLGSAVVQGTFTASSIITTDGSGISNLNATNIATGTLSSNLLPDISGMSSATFGSTTLIPQITTDAKGRVTAIQNVQIPVQTTFAASSNDSVTNPAITWTDDTNTGLYHPTADTIGITTGATERMRITATGLVGIGTSNPTNTLEVIGTSMFQGVMSGTDASGLSNLNASALAIGTVASNLLPTVPTVTAATYGSRTAIPQVTIDSYGRITSATDVYPTRFFGSNTDSAAAPSFTWSNNSNTGMYRPGADTIAFTTNSNERMRITSTGNVGIGTTTPNAPLQFANTFSNRKLVLWETANNDHQFSGFGINTNTFRYQSPGTIADHVFFAATSSTSSAELMRIKGTGNVGIGTSNPLTQFEVRNDQNNQTIIRVTNMNANSNARATLQFLTDQDVSNTGIMFKNSTTRITDGGINTMTIRNDGGALRLQSVGGYDTNKGIWISSNDNYIGVNTNNPIYMLDVNGTTRFADNIFVTSNITLSNQVLASATNSASQPAYSWTNNTNTGMFLATGCNLGFTTAGTERIRITSNGFVGINNAAPQAELALSSNSAIRKLTLYDMGNDNQFCGFGLSPQQFRYNVNTVIDAHVFYAGVSSSESTELMRVVGNGRVGINNRSSPSYTLDVNGDVNTASNIRINGIIIASSNQFFAASADSQTVPGYAWVGDSNTGMFRPSSKTLALTTNGTERIRLDSNGYIGIGTTAPNAPLQFANTAANRKIVLFDDQNNDHQYLGFGVNNGILRFQIPSTAHHQVFYAGTSTTTSTELMRITGTGRLGINNSAPLYPLDVNGDMNTTSNVRINGTIIANSNQFLASATDTVSLPGYTWVGDTNTGLYHPAADTIGFATGGTEKVRIRSDAFIHVGTSNPGYSISGQERLSMYQPSVSGTYSNHFALTCGWGGYHAMCGLAWNVYSTGNANYLRYNSNYCGWSILNNPVLDGLWFMSYGNGYTGCNIPQGARTIPLSLYPEGACINFNYPNTSFRPTEALTVNGKICSCNQFLNTSSDSVTAPSYSFKEDSNTGMYHPATSTLGFSTNGVERLRVDATGNVGINTSSPQYTLDVTGESRITNGPLILEGGTVSYLSSSVDGANRSNTYIAFGEAGASTDFAYLRQIGASSGIHLALDFHDDAADARFSIRNVASYVNNPDVVSTSFIVNNSNVGINTSNPQYPLHVFGDISTTSNVRINTTIIANSNQFLASSTDTVSLPGYSWSGDPNTGLFHPAACNIGIVTSGIERIRISSQGLVGIGVPPTQEFHLSKSQNGGTVFMIENTSNMTNANAQILFATNTGTSYGRIMRCATSNTSEGSGDAMVIRNDLGILKLQTGSSGSLARGMTLSSSNLLGINTSTPAYNVDVNGNARIGSDMFVASNISFSNQLRANANDSSNAPSFSWTSDTNTGIYHPSACNIGFSTAGVERVRINQLGYIGVGKSNPSYPIHVATQSNNVSIYCDFDIMYTSDARYKTNIQVIPNALEKMDHINGYTYNRVDDPNQKRMAGVLAQEIQEVLPEVVSIDETGKMSVAYGNLVSLLIQSVKELKERVAALEQRDR